MKSCGICSSFWEPNLHTRTLPCLVYSMGYPRRRSRRPTLHHRSGFGILPAPQDVEKGRQLCISSIQPSLDSRIMPRYGSPYRTGTRACLGRLGAGGSESYASALKTPPAHRRHGPLSISRASTSVTRFIRRVVRLAAAALGTGAPPWVESWSRPARVTVRCHVHGQRAGLDQLGHGKTARLGVPRGRAGELGGAITPGAGACNRGPF